MANSNVTTKKRHAWNTTVFMKQAMAISGLFFVFFLVFHSYGNLKAFGGAAAYNGYAHHLREFLVPILPHEGLLWILRVIMVVLIAVHMVSALYLWHRGGAARGTRYDVKKAVTNSYAARTVRVGSILLIFLIIFHILHFTTKTFKVGNNAAYASHTMVVDGEKIPAMPFDMMLTTFSNWWMVLVYIVFVSIIGLHIAHGFWSAFQTMGWMRENTRKPMTVLSGLIGFAIWFMFVLPPLAIALGVIK
ncbi:MAG: succinate dehydrogenase cytochrome b subunit [Winkia neuii]|uniref:succinate dehydrogenase cytochrome b subunit n=1 Tax=Winkia neuii TaxID=33007 RepID=UPI00290CA666|nr:succinate dehydrogenase cytochrome b subunit [Winkia neuii]MDU5160939.1 succinate dehydrogenase cytochrome b subunit [Winkia neuii]